jgi:hypothetical protein
MFDRALRATSGFFGICLDTVPARGGMDSRSDRGRRCTGIDTGLVRIRVVAAGAAEREALSHSGAAAAEHRGFDAILVPCGH